MPGVGPAQEVEIAAGQPDPRGEGGVEAIAQVLDPGKAGAGVGVGVALVDEVGEVVAVGIAAAAMVMIVLDISVLPTKVYIRVPGAILGSRSRKKVAQTGGYLFTADALKNAIGL